ncbi:YesL family protein [Bacillus sp. EB106-08-02-XG196]|uniref:YesL family protein n=1 Tax=Bacillus sp. EB106-08-02-XG196 TaxID=2737049 RepID=UPI0015C4D678|nr:DUF624 domain-containing protein [Bacillus sp. EB106-08-02-XG196]NWQ40314.1 YesL family protein [Bacillus sp. EB106-08-02-XG196]
MAGLFDIDNRFFRFATKVMNLFLLNILWIIFSLPIVTVGAATSAVYYVSLKMVRNEEGYIINSFWLAFRQNLKQSIIIEFVFLIVGIILIWDIKYFLQMDNVWGYIFAAIFSIALTIYVFMLIFTFPILAKYSNTIYGTLKNAVIMSLTHLPASIAIAVLLMVMLYGFYVSVPLMIIFSTIGVAIYAYFGSILFRNIFEKY